MKPRILLVSHYLELGGAEISLIGLLRALDPQKVDVDLMLYSHRGPLMKYIPDWVNLLPEIPQYAQLENPLKQVFLKGYWRQGFARIKAKIKYKRWAKKTKPPTSDVFYHFLDEAVTPTLPNLHFLGTYDLAINFIALRGTITHKVSKRKSITWIHTDLKAVTTDSKLEFNSWNSFDHIVSISQDVTKSFCKIFPSLRNKIIEIENIISPNFIRERAHEFSVSLPNGGLKLLSIGRFCYAKNFDNIPDIASHIINNGFQNFKWYIIGFGIDEELIKNKIKEAGMDEHVIILGKKENPYPYIEACDVYIQPSRFEGKSVTIREAQILKKPVLVTNFATASSQINNGLDGVIIPLNNKDCAKNIIQFLSNLGLRNRIISNLNNTDFGNESEVNKIYDLL